MIIHEDGCSTVVDVSREGVESRGRPAGGGWISIERACRGPMAPRPKPVGASGPMFKHWIYQMLRLHGPEDRRLCDRFVPTARRSPHAASGSTASVAVAVVDDRPVALVFPATRCVVLDRLKKLFRADEVRLASGDEVDRFLGDSPTGAPRPAPAPPGVPLLLDASLLSARALEIRSSDGEEPVRLTLEDWLASANPIVGFFTEPARRHDA